MNNRRDFLKNAGALTLGGLLLPQLTEAEQLFGPAASRPIGIQLFTLFRQMNEDPKRYSEADSGCWLQRG
jgi:hypothetical protein